MKRSESRNGMGRRAMQGDFHAVLSTRLDGGTISDFAIVSATIARLGHQSAWVAISSEHER